MTALDDRRQRAREAFWDAYGPSDQGTPLDVAIEAATRVRITPEVIRAFNTPNETVAGLAAAFRAAGFEVEG